MQSYRLTKQMANLALLASLFFTIQTEQRTLIKRQTTNKTTNKTYSDTLKNHPQIQDYSFLRSPFIVLMSRNTISIAQLPMIENGNLTDVYHMISAGPGIDLDNTDGDLNVAPYPGNTGVEHEEDFDDDQTAEQEGNEESRKIKSGQRDSGSDAREYEQQMPRSTIANASVNTISHNNNNSASSLGKSEWQQIASATSSPSLVSSVVRDREEVWPQMQTVPLVEGGDRKASGEVENSSGPRRRRRSNSFADYDGANSIKQRSRRRRRSNDDLKEEHGDNASEAFQAKLRVNSVEESSSSQNVTSAQSATTIGSYNEPTMGRVHGDVQGGQPAAVSAEDGDKNRLRGTHYSGPSSYFSLRQQQHEPANTPESVRFCDFDVHMSLGYAFAADSTGRIHRFKLPSAGFASASSSSQRTTASDSATESDYTNTIDSAGNGENPSNQANHHHRLVKLNSRTAAHQRKDEPSSGNNIRSDENDTVRSSIDNDDVGSNSSDATSNANKVNHEDGDDAAVAADAIRRLEQTDSESDRQHPEVSGGTSLRDGTPTSGSASSSSSSLPAQQLLNSDETVPAIDGSEPRIIWSRKRKPNALLRKSVSSKHSRAHLQLHLDSDKQGASPSEEAPIQSKVTAHNEQQAGDDSSSDAAVRATTSLNNSDFKLSRYRRPTETLVAVDWISNLLFVLDKYRLLVVDFNGNNELVLIDDFNPITRPIDMKVDPVNNFLFWLQAGRFHNTIYKLDLNVLSMPSATQRLVGNTLRLRQSGLRTLANLHGNSQQQQQQQNNDSENVPTTTFDSSDLVALVSHHYAHPIITNLPRHISLFTIDHKHSRIYVPLNNREPASQGSTGAFDSGNQIGELTPSTKREETEVFAPTNDLITHLNSTADVSIVDNCTTTTAPRPGQILAYNLDGTDVGPLRKAGENSHITTLDDIIDFTLDTKHNLLYWLTNQGREMFEEYREGTTIHPAQHHLEGRSYSKLIHFDHSNQPIVSIQAPRFNLRNIIQSLASSLSPNRLTRSDGQDMRFEDGVRASSLNIRQRMGSDGDVTRFSRNAPYIILGITCLIVVTVYLIYTLIFQQLTVGRSENQQNHSPAASIDCDSIGDSTRYDTDRRTRGDSGGDFLSPRWHATGPSMRSATDTSTFERDIATSTSRGVGAYDLGSSSNYDASNAIDEHYRNDSSTNQSNYCDESQSFDLKSPRLVDIGAWPTRMLGMNNKLYVPVELLQDETLSSIRRISMDQLEIERKAPLGEGHFGTVLQGKVQFLTMAAFSERANTTQTSLVCGSNHLDQSRLRPHHAAAVVVGSSSASSSGHGSSSSASGEFITANSCSEAVTAITNDEDYLTPKNQLSDESRASDFGLDDNHFMSQAVSSACQSGLDSQLTTRVAIKKLKENASADEKRDFLQEAKLLANFEHPNIVQLIGICLDRGSTLIVMELMLGGDLIRYMQENTPGSASSESEELSYDDLLQICLDIVNGCCYLEELDYIHRDLAARNCLVSSKKREERVVKLSDFGLARDIYKDKYYKKVNDSAMPLKWMAPECLSEQKFTKKSDVWSFGVVLWEVMGYCKEKPYGGVQPFFMRDHLASGARLRRPDNCDEDMYKLMLECWQMEPDERPTFSECRAILIEIKNGRSMH